MFITMSHINMFKNIRHFVFAAFLFCSQKSMGRLGSFDRVGGFEDRHTKSALAVLYSV